MSKYWMKTESLSLWSFLHQLVENLITAPYNVGYLNYKTKRLKLIFCSPWVETVASKIYYVVTVYGPFSVAGTENPIKNPSVAPVLTSNWKKLMKSRLVGAEFCGFLAWFPETLKPGLKLEGSDFIKNPKTKACFRPIYFVNGYLFHFKTSLFFPPSRVNRLREKSCFGVVWAVAPVE